MKSVLKVGVVAAVAVILWACGGSGAAETPADSGAAPTTTLGASDVATIATAHLREGVPLSGALAPKVNVTVGAPVAEQIAEMLVDEGVAVRQGQPMARFRDEVLRAAAASAQAEVTRAQLAVRMGVADSARSESLFREGAIARRDYDNALVALESMRAQLALAQAQAASANDRLETATLRAPVAGVVSERHVQAGDRVDFGKPVLTIVDTRVLQLEASVPAQALGALRVGRVASLVTSSGDTVAGRIARINPTADPATRQVRVYVDVPNGAGRLVGGLYVSGHAIVRDVSGAVAVPKRAVRIEGEDGASVVYVVRDGVIAKVRVQLGVEDAAQGLLQVIAGLAAGDTVVIGPVEGLADGTRVQVAGSGAGR